MVVEPLKYWRTGCPSTAYSHDHLFVGFPFNSIPLELDRLVDSYSLPKENPRGSKKCPAVLGNKGYETTQRRRHGSSLIRRYNERCYYKENVFYTFFMLSFVINGCVEHLFALVSTTSNNFQLLLGIVADAVLCGCFRGAASC